MSRFGSIGTQYFDNDGKPLSGGKLTFFVTNTTTPLTTYSDPGQTIANPHPVVLDASGRQPNIFFTGVAKVELSTSADVLVEVRDPVGIVVPPGEWADWSAGTAYPARAFVRASDGRTYQSAVGANIGNDPVTSPDKWQQVVVVGVWNPDYTYFAGDVVLRAEPGDPLALFRCRVATSLFDFPEVQFPEWENITQELDDPLLYGFREAVEAAVDAPTTTIDATNSSSYSWSLGANRSVALAGFTAGRSVLLNIGATSFSIDWSGNSITWLGGSAPTLSPSARTFIQIWQDGVARYGTLVGYT
jgi:hypothetical protein